MKISRIELQGKTTQLPFPIYLKENEIDNAEIIIKKLSKHEWSPDRKEEFLRICEQIREFLND